MVFVCDLFEGHTRFDMGVYAIDLFLDGWVCAGLNEALCIISTPSGIR
nr:hypothetical protein [Sulfitobacter aestuariivivens]